MDKIITAFKDEQPDFVAGYQQARKLVDAAKKARAKPAPQPAG